MDRNIKIIDNISGLQAFQLLKFLVFFIISVALTKSTYSAADIGKWEMFLFIAGLLSFFWVTGIIQSLLPLYHRNKSFHKFSDHNDEKSPEIFNAFILLTFISLLVFILGHSLKGTFSVFRFTGNVPFINLLFLYILLSSPVCLIEYIYLLNNRSYRILQYSLYTFGAQLVFIMVPIILGKGIIWAIYGLIAVCMVRWVWLIVLLKKYSKPEISVDFMKEHLYFATPLIITTLISGSAQYVDGVIVTTAYHDPTKFAFFRYGAKEFPLTLMLANGLNNAMIPEFALRNKIKESLQKIKVKSKEMMHILFPIIIVVMFFARWIYPRLFSPEFEYSSSVFMIYLLLIIPRLLFPQTILMGRKKNWIVLGSGILEFAVNVPLSLLMIRWGYGMVGVALATFIVYTISKMFMIGYLWIKMNIKPAEYIPLVTFLIYSALTTALFILIDHRIIDFS